MAYEEIVDVVMSSKLSLGARSWLKSACRRAPIAPVVQGNTTSITNKERTPTEQEFALRRAESSAVDKGALIREALADKNELDNWPWAGTGRSARLAPTFLDDIYAKGCTARVWADNFVSGKGIMGSAEASELKLCASIVDRLLITDGIKITKCAAGEIAARRMHAIERSLANVKSMDCLKKGKKRMDIYNGIDMVEYDRSGASAAVDAQLLAELKQGALLEKHRALPA